MDKSSIENKIKGRLHGHSEYIDNELLFEALGIAEKPKRRGVFWIPMLFLFGVIVGAAVLHYSSGDSDIVNEDEPMNEELQLSEEEVVSGGRTQKFTSLKGSQVDRKSAGELANAKNISGIEDIQVDKESEVEVALAKRISNSTAMAVEVSQEVYEVSNTQLESNYGFRQKETQNTFKLIDDENMLFAPTKKGSDGVDAPSNQNTTNSVNSILPLQANVDVTKGQSGNLIPTTVEVDACYLQMLWNDISYKEEWVHVLGDARESNEVFGTTERLSSWSILPFLSYDRFNTTLISDPSLLAEYRDVRSTSEIELEQVGGGVLMKYKFNDNWFTEFGLEFNQYNTRVSLSEFLYSTERDSLDFYRVNYLGDSTLFSGGVGAIEIEIERQWTKYNALQMIQIPVSLGYELHKNRYSVFTQVGLNVGVYSRFVGSLYNDDFTIVENPSYYRILPNVSLELGVGGTYNLTEKYAVYTKFRYRSSLHSISSAINPLDERINQIGIVVGCVYKL